MLPAAPKDVGRLSDVLSSLLAATGQHVQNAFRLPRVNHAVLILVDGMGFENLTNHKGHARFLGKSNQQSIRCEFPSTTATSLTGMATGKRSGDHGVIGYSVFNRDTSRVENLLTGWNSWQDAIDYKRVQDLSEATNISTFAIGPELYRDSGFTALTMSKATYKAAETISERFELLKLLQSSETQSITYLYIPELDQAAHRYGVDSKVWIEILESIDSEIEKFSKSISVDTGALVTADHGVIDVQKSQQIYFDDLDWYCQLTMATAGDPRCNFIYLRDPAKAENFRSRFQIEFGEIAYLVTPTELTERGWTTRFDESFDSILPDFYSIWNVNRVAYDRRFARPAHLEMIGQHGGISDAEMRIPLIRLGRFS